MTDRPRPSRTPISARDLDMVARAFGFQSASHLDQVLKGKSPSALAEGSKKWESTS